MVTLKDLPELHPGLLEYIEDTGQCEYNTVWIVTERYRRYVEGGAALVEAMRFRGSLVAFECALEEFDHRMEVMDWLEEQDIERNR
jgi:hypothetical protein